MIKFYILGAILFLIGGAVLVLAPRGGADASLSLKADAGSFRFAPVVRGDLVVSVNATGNLKPVATVLVGTQVSGQMKDIYADFNAEVKRGQPIALIDPVSFQIAVEQAQADLEVARAAVEMQKSGIKRMAAAVATAHFDHKAALAATDAARIRVQEAAADMKRKLALAGSVSTAEREKAQFAHQTAIAQVRGTEAVAEAKASQARSAEADLATARSQLINLEAVVRQKEAALRNAQVELERTVIRAPVDGVVVTRSIEAGQTVAASLQAPTLFTIAQDLRQMQVEAAIDESEIGRIKGGQNVEFTVDAYPGRRFAGTVSQVRKSPTTVQNVVTYTVVVDASNPELLLLPGMTASTRFIIDRTDDVLKVPNGALRFRRPDKPLPSGKGVIWSGNGASIRAIPVDVGLTDEWETEVSGDGLREGTRIITGAGKSGGGSSGSKRLIGGF